VRTVVAIAAVLGCAPADVGPVPHDGNGRVELARRQTDEDPDAFANDWAIYLVDAAELLIEGRQGQDEVAAFYLGGDVEGDGATIWLETMHPVPGLVVMAEDFVDGGLPEDDVTVEALVTAWEAFGAITSEEILAWAESSEESYFAARRQLADPRGEAPAGQPGGSLVVGGWGCSTEEVAQRYASALLMVGIVCGIAHYPLPHRILRAIGFVGCETLKGAVQMTIVVNGGVLVRCGADTWAAERPIDQASPGRF
jgi:hypothetical protein